MNEAPKRKAKLTKIATDILGSEKNAISFLSKEHKLLDNITPYKAALTKAGAKRVEGILGKIFYGLPV